MANPEVNFKIVLVAPEIPGNTGSIGRTCVALGCELILIHPYGFELNEKAVRRAGLDYWKHVKLTEYDSWDHFLEGEEVSREQLYFFSKRSEKVYFEAEFNPGSYLIFGSETQGLPADLFMNYPEQFFKIPMYSEEVRSLNLANAATAIAYECLRQQL